MVILFAASLANLRTRPYRATQRTDEPDNLPTLPCGFILTVSSVKLYVVLTFDVGVLECRRP